MSSRQGNREYVSSVAVYQKYPTRLGELIIFKLWCSCSKSMDPLYRPIYQKIYRPITGDVAWILAYLKDKILLEACQNVFNRILGIDLELFGRTIASMTDG